jgi:hypothetical protein
MDAAWARAAADADRDAAIEQTRTEATWQVRAAGADRDQGPGPGRAGRPGHPSERSRTLPTRGRLSKPPGPRPAGSTPTRRKFWSASAPTLPATATTTATNCASTCGPGLSTPNARPTPAATNSPSFALGPATTPTPPGRPGRPSQPPSRNAPRSRSAHRSASAPGSHRRRTHYDPAPSHPAAARATPRGRLEKT